MKIKTVENKVRVVLENHPPARDDDMILFAAVCANTYGKLRCEAMNGWEMLGKISHSKVPHFTSVLRCRQILQKQNKELRGKKYEKRINKYQEEVRIEMRNWNNAK